MDATTRIKEINDLDTVGRKNRRNFLAAYEQDVKYVPTTTAVQNSYELFLKEILGCSSYIFVTVNLRTSALRKLLDAERRNNAGLLPDRFLPLGQEYYDAICSGASNHHDAFATLWNKFFIRLNQKLLGSQSKHFGGTLKWLAIAENPSKRYRHAPINHVHMLVEVPAIKCSLELNEVEIKRAFRNLFSELVYPVPFLSKNNALLDIQQAPLTESNPYTKYMLKQLNTWSTASERIQLLGFLNKQGSSKNYS